MKEKSNSLVEKGEQSLDRITGGVRIAIDKNN
jgi:hypothetical protein